MDSQDHTGHPFIVYYSSKSNWIYFGQSMTRTHYKSNNKSLFHFRSDKLFLQISPFQVPPQLFTSQGKTTRLPTADSREEEADSDHQTQTKPQLSGLWHPGTQDFLRFALLWVSSLRPERQGNKWDGSKWTNITVLLIYFPPKICHIL